ncbi:MAG: S-layer homology domain-containing protein [Defluviitaleaceae bacterium]|nr:S-layer homology domain-containing protein [Defluviitaleaceae bacterium]
MKKPNYILKHFTAWFLALALAFAIPQPAGIPVLAEEPNIACETGECAGHTAPELCAECGGEDYFGENIQTSEPCAECDADNYCEHTVPPDDCDERGEEDCDGTYTVHTACEECGQNGYDNGGVCLNCEQKENDADNDSELCDECDEEDCEGCQDEIRCDCNPEEDCECLLADNLEPCPECDGEGCDKCELTDIDFDIDGDWDWNGDAWSFPEPVTGTLDFTEMGEEDLLAEYGWAWFPDGNDEYGLLTLVLSGLAMFAEEGDGIVLPGGSTIILDGFSAVTSENNGITSHGALTLKGEGHLYADAMFGQAFNTPELILPDEYCYYIEKGSYSFEFECVTENSGEPFVNYFTVKTAAIILNGCWNCSNNDCTDNANVTLDFTLMGETDRLVDEGWAWFPGGSGGYGLNTLVLDGLNLTHLAAGSAIILPGGSSIFLLGNADILSWDAGIYALGSLAIEGLGALKITAHESAVNAPGGLNIIGSTLTAYSFFGQAINGDVNVSAAEYWHRANDAAEKGGKWESGENEPFVNSTAYKFAEITTDASNVTECVCERLCGWFFGELLINGDCSVCAEDFRDCEGAFLAVTPMAATTIEERIDLTDNPQSASGPGWSWAGAPTNTLTLNGLDLRVSGGTGLGTSAIRLPDNVNSTVTLIGNNTITNSTTGTNRSMGIFIDTTGNSTGSLTINGSGTLNINVSNTGANNSPSGLYLDHGTININGGTLNITAASSNIGAHVYPIYINRSITKQDINIDNSTVNIVSSGASSSSFGITTANGDINITDSTVDIIASGGETQSNYGLFAGAGGQVKINSGTVSITTGTGGTSRAIRSNNNTNNIHNLPAEYWYKNDAEASAWTTQATEFDNEAGAYTFVRIASIDPTGATVPSGPYNVPYSLFLDPSGGRLKVGNPNGADVTDRFNSSNISFDDDVWTLNNFVFKSSLATAVIIPNTTPAVTLNLTGTNSIESTFNGSPPGTGTPPIVGLQIYSDANAPVIIEGSGDLTATGGTGASSTASYGINAPHLTIRGNATVNANGGNTASAVSAGVNTDGVLTVEGSASLNATGGTPTTATNSRGINVTGAAGHLKVNGGTVTATAVSGGRSIDIANTSQMTVNGGTVNAANDINLLGTLNLNANNVINTAHAITTSARARSMIVTGATAINASTGTAETNRFYSLNGTRGSSDTKTIYVWSSVDGDGNNLPGGVIGWRVATPAEILAIALLDIAQADVASQTVTPTSSRTLAADVFVPSDVDLIITGNGAGRVTVGNTGTLTVNGGSVLIDNNAQNAITINNGRSMTILSGSVSVFNTGSSGGINLSGAGSTLTIGSADASSDVVLNLNGATSLIGTGIINGVNEFSKIIVGAAAPTKTVSNFFNANGNAVTTMSANTTYVWDSNANGAGAAGWKSQSTNPSITVTATGLNNLRVGVPVSGAKITYAISNATFAASIMDAHFTSGINNLPAGLSVGTVTREDNKVEVAITGAPTTANASALTLNYSASIPADNITGIGDPISPTGTLTLTAPAVEPVNYILFFGQGASAPNEGEWGLYIGDHFGPKYGGGGWKAEEGILHLNNFNFSTTAGTALNITTGQKTINIEGINTIETTSAAGGSTGINSSILTVTGTGSLNVKGGSAGSSYGIQADHSFIMNGGTVNATGGAYGIWAARDFIMESGTLTAISGDKALGVNRFKMTGGKLTAIGDDRAVHIDNDLGQLGVLTEVVEIANALIVRGSDDKAAASLDAADVYDPAVKTFTVGGAATKIIVIEAPTPQSITAATYSDGPYSVGNQITVAAGKYTANYGGAAGTHTFKWFRSDDNIGKAAFEIDGAASPAYTPAAADFGKWIAIETTPVGDGSLTGTPVMSEWIQIGVRITANAAGADGASAITVNGTAGATGIMVYSASAVNAVVTKNTATDTIAWTSSGNAGSFGDAEAASTTYTPPAAPTGDITLTATLTEAVALSNDTNLSALTISSGTLTPVFASATTAYTVSVGNAVSNVTVTPTVSDTGKAAVTVNGIAVKSGGASGSVSLSVGSNNIITIVVTAEDNTTKTYTITVTRQASSGNQGNNNQGGDNQGRATPRPQPPSPTPASTTASTPAPTPVPVITVPGRGGTESEAGEKLDVPVTLDKDTGGVAIKLDADNKSTLITEAITLAAEANAGKDEGEPAAMPVVTLDVSGVEDAKSATFDVDAAEAFSSAEVAVTVVLPAAAIIMTPETLATLAETTDVGTTPIRVEASIVPMRELRGMQAAQVKGFETVISIDVFVGDEKVDVPLTVSLPYDLQPNENPKAVRVWYMDGYGSLTDLNGVFDAETGMITFTINHQSYFVVGYDPVALWENIFGDVHGDDWFYDAVAFANYHGLMNGYGDDSFAPQDTMTRAMFAAVLWTIAGQPEIFRTTGYNDVAPGAWYYDAVVWTVENNITSGLTFDPGRAITRLEMATMLYNFTVAYDYEIPTNRAVPAFTDMQAIESAWELNAANRISAAGILSGFDNEFMPHNDATRAQVAQMFRNFMRFVVW